MFVFVAAELTGIAAAPRWSPACPSGRPPSPSAASVLLYTGYGGLRASIVTDVDSVQAVLHALAVAAVGAVFALGGLAPSTTASRPTSPRCSTWQPRWPPVRPRAPSFATGGAELINQTWWQRIYAGESSETVASA